MTGEAALVIEPEFPPKLQCLFQPSRYKVLWGGRGAGRSWGIARALLIKGLGGGLRVLCARELQNSIADSVHKVLSDQINMMGLEQFYDIQRDRIIGQGQAAGTSFAFEGVKNNVNRIKSYEGIDICWVEEAVKVTRMSWGVLIPTIRKEGSEIWMSFNPEYEEDYTYQEYVLRADENMTVVHMTFRDNPWFPPVLQTEMLRDKRNDPDRYLNVWEGQCIQILDGVVFAKELRRCAQEGRICTVGWDREWPVDTFWDLGRADATAIWFGQRVAMQYRILGYYQATGEDITHYLRELQRRGYVYGRHYLPHDAKAKRLGSRRTIEEIIRASYPQGVYVVPRHAKTDSLNAARIIFPNCWFDEDNCKDGLKALRNYKYRVLDDQGHFANEPLHDWASDGADAFMTMALALTGPKAQPRVRDFDLAESLAAKGREFAREAARAATGWMR